MLPNFRTSAYDLGRVLLTVCVTAGFAATSASASDDRFPFVHPVPTAPVAKAQPDPKIAPAATRHNRHKEMTRKLSAEKKVAEKLPPGPLQVVISIRKQQLTLFAGGRPVAHSQVSTGVPGHPTPQGVFSVLEKQIYHRVQHLQRGADAVHAAHHMVRRCDASGRRAEPPGLAWLHPPAG